jgi:diguanylate cyclase (GGDEF)-like protein
MPAVFPADTKRMYERGPDPSTAPWRRLPAAALLVLLAACDGLVALLQQAQGGSAAGYGPLLVLPVVAAAFVVGRRGVLVATAGAAATLVAPIVAVGAPSYPTTGLRGAAVLTVVAAIVGLVIERGVGPVRRGAGDASHLAAADGSQAGTDALTGVPNLRSFDEQLARALAHARRTNETVSVAVCGIDGVGSPQGHPSADDLLRVVVDRWRIEARAADLIGRIGVAELALLLPGADEAGAEDVLARLVDVLPAAQFVAVGVAEWDLRESSTELVERALERMRERTRRSQRTTS